MAQSPASPTPTARPGAIALVTVYFFYATVVVRTLGIAQIRSPPAALPGAGIPLRGPVHPGALAPAAPPLWQHLYFVFQSALILFLFSLRTEFDFLVTLFVLLSFQAALIFTGRARWMWVTC